MLGVRTTNLAFEARIPGHAGELQPGTGTRPILSYGPWYQGRYDGVSIGIRKRMTRHFTTEAFYTWTNAIDNALRSSFVSEVQTGLGAGVLGAKGPTDSFIGHSAASHRPGDRAKQRERPLHCRCQCRA